MDVRIPELRKILPGTDAMVLYVAVQRRRPVIEGNLIGGE
jgi:hypothetical protein